MTNRRLSCWSCWSCWCVVLIVVLGGVLALVERVRAQQPCTPYLLCPYPSGGSGGRAGVGGAGIGGRGGAGGAGGIGGRGGQGGSGGTLGLVVSAALELDPRALRAGSVLNGSVSYRNASASAIAVREIRIAARAPGATHEGGPFTDLAPVLSGLTVEPGASVTLSASRQFSSSDPIGTWEAYSTYQDSAGKWHDAPSENFQVARSVSPPTPSGGMQVGTQEWYVAPWAGTNIYKSGVNWSTAYSSGADIWNPQFMSELRGYSAFRHMDTNCTNHSQISSWSQRKLPTDPGNQEIYIDGGSPANTTGMAIEWQIDLCNRASVDCWFTLPYLASDDYVRQQAQLTKDRLDPALRIYVELSNEVWNGSFRAYQQAIDAGIAGGLPGSNQWYQGIAHEMFRALAVYQIYASVFGAGAMGERVVRVFSESGNLDLTTQALRNVYASSHWNPHGQKIDLLALAPYIGNGTDGASETLGRWKSEVDSKVNGEPIAYAVEHHLQPYSIPSLGCYEAGMHHLSHADAWAKNPSSYDGYVYMLDRFATRMNGVCMLYTLHGTWEAKGAWGVYNAVGQPLAQAHKARAASEWIAGTATREAFDLRLLVLGLIVLLVLVIAALLLRHAHRKDL